MAGCDLNGEENGGSSLPNREKLNQREKSYYKNLEIANKRYVRLRRDVQPKVP